VAAASGTGGRGAVRNTILKLRGIDTMEDFLDRQRRAMDS